MKDGTRLVWQAGEPRLPASSDQVSAWHLAPVGSLLAALLQRGYPSEQQDRAPSKRTDCVALASPNLPGCSLRFLFVFQNIACSNVGTVDYVPRSCGETGAWKGRFDVIYGRREALNATHSSAFFC